MHDAAKIVSGNELDASLGAIQKPARTSIFLHCNGLKEPEPSFECQDELDPIIRLLPSNFDRVQRKTPLVTIVFKQAANVRAL